MSEAIHRFPYGKERKVDAIQKARAADREIHTAGVKKQWPIYDSGLDKTTTTSSYPMRTSFMDVIPSEWKSLRKYIESDLEAHRGTAVGIEFGGPGSAVFKEFSKGFFEQSIGVTLVDERMHAKNMNRLLDADVARNHSIVEGDVLADSTYKEVEFLLGGRKVDFILERMWGGLNQLPNEPIAMAEVFQRWYQMLGDDGLMLIEVPRNMTVLFEEWLEKYSDSLVGKVELETNIRNYGRITTLALRIKKLPDAPASLPLLTAREAKRMPGT